MATTPSRTGHAPADHARSDVERLPVSTDTLGCRSCGLPAQEHGSSVIHRFVRPDLPDGYRYRDELGTGDELALHRRPVEQSTIVVAPRERTLGVAESGRLWLPAVHPGRSRAGLADPGSREAGA